MSDPRTWSRDEIARWIGGQDWYQTIPVRDGLVTPGKTRSDQRLRLLPPLDLAGRSLLDVGCNSGMYCFEAARRGASRVVGIDVDRRRLDQARTLAAILGLDVELHQMDLAAAPALGRFDVVFCFAVLTEIGDLLGSLAALARLTGGRLYLELAVTDAGGPPLGLTARRLAARAAQAVLPDGLAALRRTKTGWSLAPTLRLVERVVGDEMEVRDLGPSVRYRLLELVRRPAR